MGGPTNTVGGLTKGGGWPERALSPATARSSYRHPSPPHLVRTPCVIAALCRPRLSRLSWSYLILDEGHRLKARATLRVALLVPAPSATPCSSHMPAKPQSHFPPLTPL